MSGNTSEAMAKGLEKSPLQSKKFLAYLISQVLWKALAFTVVVMAFKESKIDTVVALVLLALFLIAGFGEALYIGGQAALDKYVRVAKIAAVAGTDMTIKGLSFSKNGHKPPSDDDDKKKPEPDPPAGG